MDYTLPLGIAGRVCFALWGETYSLWNIPTQVCVCFSEQCHKGPDPSAPGHLSRCGVAPDAGAGQRDWICSGQNQIICNRRVISRSNGHRFRLVLSLTLWVLLNSCTFFDSVCERVNSWKLKVILMIIAPQWQREKAGRSARLRGPLPTATSFLTDWLPWIPGDGAERVCVCNRAAATDLWTWHAWEYRITMATTNMG